MATVVRMPAVSASAESATLHTWHIAVGDAVAAGQPLAEIETDKAVVDLEAPAAGTVAELLVEAGREADVGAALCVLLAAGEQHDPVLLDPDPAPPGAPSEAAAPAPSAPTIADVHRLVMSPLARRLAAERGVDLTTVRGSGPGGRIVRRDIEAASPATAPLASASPATALAPPIEPERVVAAPPARRLIARRMSESKATIPHFYVTVDCRVDRLLRLRREVAESASVKVSLNDFVVLAAARALRAVPEVNTRWESDSIVYREHADIAVAVDTPSGIVAPVIRDVGSRRLTEISESTAELAGRARRNELRPDDLRDGSFTVSNLGMFGVSEFTAIITPGQAAAVAIGAAVETPVVTDGHVEVGHVMRCTLSADHRCIDGATAARWLAAFRAEVEAPIGLLL